MPRALRVEYPGATYHVMDRGDRRDNLFVNDVDRQDLLGIEQDSASGRQEFERHMEAPG